MVVQDMAADIFAMETTTELDPNKQSWIHGADFTVYLGMVLVGLLMFGLGAYLAFVARVTYRENRRAKRLAEILKNTPVSFNNNNECVQGVQSMASPPNASNAAYSAAYNAAYQEDKSDYYEYNEKF